MIPTQHKSKLPKTLSWPMGAESISMGLLNAPHIDQLSLWFSDSPVWPASAFQTLLRESQPYEILVASYSPPSRPGYCGANFMVERGAFNAKWELRVYPVLRSVRAVAASLLKEQGLPALAQWLRSFGSVGWEAHHQRMSLTFAPMDGTLELECTESA